MDLRTQTTLPRGLRNNNPGNIQANDSWQGAVGADAQNFIIFSDTTWGLRAIAKSLANMINNGCLQPDGTRVECDTIATLIPHWSLTDQAAYVANVSAATGIDPNTQLGTDADTLGGLIRAICNQENGAALSAQYISDQDINQGISMAGFSVSTIVQAVAIDAQTQPLVYVVGAALLGFAIWLFTRKR